MPNQWKRSRMLPCESSGVVRVSESQFLVISDEPGGDAVTLITMKQEEIISARLFPAAGGLNDLEGIALKPGSESDKQTVYVISGDGVLSRFELQDGCLIDASVQSIPLKGAMKVVLKDHCPKGSTFNFEGLAWHGMTNGLLIGLREPLSRKKKKAMMVSLPDPDALIDGLRTIPDFGKPIKVDLGGHAIRDLANSSSDSDLLYLIAGPSNGGNQPFALWTYRLSTNTATRLSISGIDIEHAEGIEHVPAGATTGPEGVLLVRDTGSDLERLQKAASSAINAQILESSYLEGQYMRLTVTPPHP